MLFYLDPSIAHDPNLADVTDITLTYHFYPSADQTIAHVLQNEIEKHQAEEKKLIERRTDLEAKGIKLPEVAGQEKGKHGVLAPGHNPTETPEMFVKKIIQNRKRLEYTIKKFEEDEKKKL